MNETISNVDIEYRQIIWELISSMKITIIITFHSLKEAKPVTS
jgi:ABC-type multidrug transport system ATPase subunit